VGKSEKDRLDSIDFGDHSKFTYVAPKQKQKMPHRAENAPPQAANALGMEVILEQILR